MNSSVMIEPLYVVDTHALIWYLTGSPRLSRRVVPIFRAAERSETDLVISVMVIAEMFYANKKTKLFDDFAETLTNIKSKPYFDLINFAPDDVLEFEKTLAVAEMHDRIIVALAQKLNAPLITSDHRISTAGLVRVIW